MLFFVFVFFVFFVFLFLNDCVSNFALLIAEVGLRIESNAGAYLRWFVDVFCLVQTDNSPFNTMIICLE